MKGAEDEYREKYEAASYSELQVIKDERNDHYDRGVNYGTASTVLFATGGAAALVSVILLAVSYKKALRGERKAAVNIGAGVRSLVLTLNF